MVQLLHTMPNETISVMWDRPTMLQPTQHPPPPTCADGLLDVYAGAPHTAADGSSRLTAILSTQPHTSATVCHLTIRVLLPERWHCAATVAVARIDSTHANAWTAYAAMGRPRNLSASQAKRLIAASELHWEGLATHTCRRMSSSAAAAAASGEDGASTLCVNVTMPAVGVAALRVSGSNTGKANGHTSGGSRVAPTRGVEPAAMLVGGKGSSEDDDEAVEAVEADEADEADRADKAAAAAAAAADDDDDDDDGGGELILLRSYPHARCLDGSPSGYYLRRASQPGFMSRFLFVLEGGGDCSHAADCLARTKTRLGTSTVWPPTFDWEQTPITSSSARNPLAEWNTVWLVYCDGSMHTGMRTAASNETYGLWFAGHHTVNAMLDELSRTTQLNSSSGAFVAFSGGSAGALGVFANVDHVASRLPHATVVGVPIGGYVPNIVWYLGPHHRTPSEDVRDANFPTLVRLWASFLPRRCAAALGAAHEHLCLVPRIAYKYYDRPLFIMEALTDAVVTSDFEGIPLWGLFLSPPVQAHLAAYGANASANMAQVLGNPRDGLFAASCFMHCFFRFDQPQIRGVGAIDALYSWIKRYLNPTSPLDPLSGATFKWIDQCKSYWPPCNPTCPLSPNSAQAAVLEPSAFYDARAVGSDLAMSGHALPKTSHEA